MCRRYALLSALFVAAALSGCSAIDEKQRALIFQPIAQNWTSANLQDMQDVWIDFHSVQRQYQVQLHGYWLEGPTPDAPALLYLHGSRWNVTASADRIRHLQQQGFAVLAIDYRGFGQTRPLELPCETSVREDALAAWHWLHEQHPQKDRYIFGHSLGGAIAIDLATYVPNERGVLVEGTFTNVRDVVRVFKKWGNLPIEPFITQKFDSISKVAEIGSPLLVVHGERDGVIPAELGHQLFQAAQYPKQWVLVKDGTHHNTHRMATQLYQAAIQPLIENPTALAVSAYR